MQMHLVLEVLDVWVVHQQAKRLEDGYGHSAKWPPLCELCHPKHVEAVPCVDLQAIRTCKLRKKQPARNLCISCSSALDNWPPTLD